MLGTPPESGDVYAGKEDFEEALITLREILPIRVSLDGYLKKRFLSGKYHLRRINLNYKIIT